MSTVNNSTYSDYIAARMSATNTSKDTAISDSTNDILDKDDFLRLLMTELTNQDPLSPMDNKDFINQMTQFSTMEQMTNMASSLNNLEAGLSSMFQHSLLNEGAALIGKQVAGMNSTGDKLIEGIVEAVSWLEGNPQLQVRLADGSLGSIQMNEIVSVTEKPAETAPIPEETPETDPESYGTDETPVPDPTVPEDEMKV
jgi:flagellar basal-body rod modification protein FlgD